MHDTRQMPPNLFNLHSALMTTYSTSTHTKPPPPLPHPPPRLPPPPPPPPPPSLTPPLTHPLPPSPTPSLPHPPPHPLTHPCTTRSLTHLPTHPLTHPSINSIPSLPSPPFRTHLCTPSLTRSRHFDGARLHVACYSIVHVGHVCRGG